MLCPWCDPVQASTRSSLIPLNDPIWEKKSKFQVKKFQYIYILQNKKWSSNELKHEEGLARTRRVSARPVNVRLLFSFFFFPSFFFLHTWTFMLCLTGGSGGGEGYRLTILGDLVSELGRVREEWGVEHYLRKGYLKKLTAKWTKDSVSVGGWTII